MNCDSTFRVSRYVPLKLTAVFLLFLWLRTFLNTLPLPLVPHLSLVTRSRAFCNLARRGLALFTKICCILCHHSRVHGFPISPLINMPSLRQLDCQIEWANTGTAFEEYGTAYGDGVVETYIVIPSSPQNFSLRVKSQGYIFDGLAVLVFMDGKYQCNRNRLNLKPPKTGLPRSATEIDFRLRQKEKPVGDGSFIGREWRFDAHNIGKSIRLRYELIIDR